MSQYADSLGEIARVADELSLIGRQGSATPVPDVVLDAVADLHAARVRIDRITKDLATYLVLETRVTGKRVADVLEVNQSTISRWKTEAEAEAGK